MPRQKTKSGTGGITRLAAMLSGSAVRGRGRHSSLTRWLQAHHDEFAAMLSERQPSWEAVAKALAAMGLRDGEQKPPNGERVRKAWWYARQQAAARRSSQTAKPVGGQAVSNRPPALEPVPDGLPAGVERVQTSEPRPRIDIRPARPRDAAPPDPERVLPVGTATGVTAPTLAAVPSQDGLTEQLRRISEAMDAGKTPMPTVTR
jgi:hypothetical protein